MKKVILFFLLVMLFTQSYSQIENPVSWSFSSKKTGANVYEIHLTAAIENGWHLYSQTTPSGGPVPTKISFAKNPLVTMTGDAKENGKLEEHHDEMFDVNVKQFSNKVDFVQTVTVKANVKTASAGTVQFMVCNDKKCLPPKTVSFKVAL